MKFETTDLPGVHLIRLESISDERGSFARTFCVSEFAAHGLIIDVAQCNLVRNLRRGTLRGMHYQAEPYAEAKLIRCIRGSAFDVLIDLRPESPTYARWMSVKLDAHHDQLLYAPPGIAHGYQTLEDDTEFFYQMSKPYAPSHQRGVRWDDPAFGITWPEGERIISKRDRSHPLYTSILDKPT